MNTAKVSDALMQIGGAANSNRYLSSIRDAFMDFMPFTIVGAVSVMWSNVIVNDSTGLAMFVPGLMKLSFLNPVFDAVNFCTIGCISLYIAFFVGGHLAEHYHLRSNIGGAVGLLGYLLSNGTVQQIINADGEKASVSGIFSSSLGSSGLFTAMILSILAVELYRHLAQNDKLTIKLPDQVPENVAQSFAVLVPIVITAVVASAVCALIHGLSGYYLNDLIFRLLQTPIMHVGGSLPGIWAIVLLRSVLWSIGIHGENVVSGVVTPLQTAFAAENMAVASAGGTPTNIFTQAFNFAFSAAGGSGMMLGLTIAILVFGKRKENKTIARMALVPNIFNIGEINMFGLPVVLNPFLIVPFILTPLVTITLGYLLTAAGICPIFYLEVPWTTPDVLIGFLSSGFEISAILWQLVALGISVAIYAPFVKMWERSQALEEAEEEKKAEEEKASAAGNYSYES